MDLSSILGTPVRPVPYDPPKTYVLPAWGRHTDAERMAVLRRIVLSFGRDPRMATLAVQILQQSGVASRDYAGQAAALLKWTQTHIYYVNEPDERLQSPDYTLSVKYGDCDDMAIFLATLFEAVKLPWRFTLSGVDKKTRQKIRWLEGDPQIHGIQWSHIYLAVGDQPFAPRVWTFAEPTLKGAKLGWDVVGAAGNVLPEMMAGLGFGAGASPAASAGGTVAMEVASERGTVNWRQVGTAVLAGVAVTVGSQVVLDFLAGHGFISRRGA